MKYDRIEKKNLAEFKKEKRLNDLAELYACSNSLSEFLVEADLKGLAPRYKWLNAFWWHYHMKNGSLKYCWIWSAVIITACIWLSTFCGFDPSLTTADTVNIIVATLLGNVVTILALIFLYSCLESYLNRLDRYIERLTCLNGYYNEK